MVDYKYKDLFLENSIPKKATISTDNATMTNEDLYNQEMTLEETLCSEEELRFGCCEASILKFKISDIFSPMFKKQLDVRMTIDGHSDDPLLIGRYKVESDKLASDRRSREIIAYDAMYDIINADVTAWYNGILPNEDSVVSLRQFRKSFVESFGLEEEEVELVNDDEPIKRTINPEQLSGKDVITKICEINGCFGHITRDGKFRYVMLPRFIQGLYPRNDLFPANDLFPRNPRSERIGSGTYISCKYEDYQVKTIDKVQIRQEENDIGAIWPDTEISEDDNCYIIQGNFLVYGKSHEELSQIASRLLGVISGIVYRPFEADCMGNPCLEVGDAVRLSTKYELIESYILRRTLKGLQALRDDYVAEGQEKYQENVNGVQTSIIQLQGKTNILTRTVEETRLEMADIAEGLTAEIQVTAGQFRLELDNSVSQLNNTITATAAGLEGQITDTANGLQTQITANASGLSAEITRATGAEGQLSTSLKATADGLAAEITRASAAEGNLSTSISTTASGLSAEITRAKGAEGTLTNSIKVTADGLAEEITRATGAEGTLSTEIKATAGDLAIEVKRATKEEGELSSRLSLKPDSIALSVNNQSTSAGITISLKNEKGETVGNVATGTIEMTGLVKFTDLSGNGTTTINGANIKTGTISAARIDSDNLKVKAANITGTLTIGQLPSSVAETSDIPTEKQITTITETAIKTTNVVAENLHVKSANIDGTITADALNVTDLSSLGAKIGGFTIGATSIYNNKSSLNASGNGIYIGTDGISCGPSVNYWRKNSANSFTYASNPAFKVTPDGSIFIGLGSLAIGSGQNHVTTIDGGSIEVQNSPTSSHTKSVIGEGSVTTIGYSTSTGVGNAELSYTGIVSTGSQDFSITAHGKKVFSAVRTNGGIIIGVSGNRLGFFGTTPATQQSVSKISNTSNASVSSNATKINEIIDALKNYGLM